MNNDGLDPIFASGIRELKWILVAWLVSCTWVVGYCYLFGYDIAPDEMTTVFGMPSWVFWGVLCPWVASTSFTAWFAMCKMQDQELPADPSAESADNGDAGDE